MTTASQVLKVELSSIAIGERVGFFNRDHANALGRSMAAEGQHAPIQLQRNGNAAKLRWKLVAGLHRLRGAESIGWDQIDAIVVADARSTDLEVKRLELAENLSHRFRRPIERAMMMAAHAEIEEAADHPDTIGEASQVRAARARHHASVTVTDAQFGPATNRQGWRERTAAAFDVSLTTLERHQRLYQATALGLRDLAQALNDHPLGENFRAMLEIAKLDDLKVRRKVAETLLSRTDWPNIKAVFVEAEVHHTNGNRSTKVAADGHKLRKIWSGMTPDAQRAHFVEMASQMPLSLIRETIAELKKRLP